MSLLSNLLQPYKDRIARFDLHIHTLQLGVKGGTTVFFSSFRSSKTVCHLFSILRNFCEMRYINNGILNLVSNVDVQCTI